MEFLYKLYDMEYFAVGLLIVIAILVFLFLLILFFGKKEEKERKLEETKKLQLENNGVVENNIVNEEVKVPEIPQPVLEPVVENEVNEEIPTFENPFVKEELKVEQPEASFDIPAMNKDVVEPTVTMEVPEITPVVEPELSETNNDNLLFFDIPVISNDNQVDNSFVSDVVEEKKEDTVLPEIDIDSLFQTTNNEEVKLELPVEEPTLVQPVVEEKVELPKVEAPFSSVYTNNELPKVSEEKKETKVFELPKMAEMPKLKEESNVEKVNDFDSLFGDIEPETYSIKK